MKNCFGFIKKIPLVILLLLGVAAGAQKHSHGKTPFMVSFNTRSELPPMNPVVAVLAAVFAVPLTHSCFSNLSHSNLMLRSP